MLEGILHQCDIDFRISALEDSYSFRKNFFFMYSLKTDTQRTFQPFFRPLGQRYGMLQFLQNRFDGGIKLFPGICQDNFSFCTFKQSDIQLLFQCNNILAHCGLGDMILFGSFCEIQMLRHRNKIV